MNTVKKLWESYKAKRIDRIANWPTSKILSNRWVKRSLAVIAVLSSWFYLLLLVPRLFAPLDPATPYQLLTGLLMLGSFMLLRQSVKRITSLPDEHLDEREIENRDWSYRTGYLVVRRIGLVLTLGYVSFGIYMRISNPLIVIVDGIQQPHSDAESLWNSGSNYIREFLAPDPMFQTLLILVLLTFVAYSFPVILLAWREAKSHGFVQPDPEWQDSLARYSKGYFRRLIRSLWVFGLSYVMVIGHLQDFWINLVVLGFAYSIYLYFWGLFIQFEILGKLKGFIAADSLLQRKRKLLAILNYGAALLGLGILVSNLLTKPKEANFCAPIAVVFVIIIQFFAFYQTKKMAGSEK